jgi:hypothetical protein
MFTSKTTPNPWESQRRQIVPIHYKDTYYKVFCNDNIQFISTECTRRLAGVHPDNKNIIVSCDNILNVLDTYYENGYHDPDNVTMMAIAFIVEAITNEFDTIANNNKLSAWVQLYTRDTGLQRVPKIKLREKRPTPMIFNMNY